MRIRLLLIPLLVLLASSAWAFPDNGVLDTFTGVDDTTPPNANWTNAPLFGATSANVRIRSNGVTTDSGGNEADAYWDTTSFNAAQEAYATATLAGATTYTCVWVRLANIGSNTTDGYTACGLNSSSTVKIFRVDNGAATEIGSDAQAFTSGDGIGLTANGSQLCPWFNDGGGGWVRLTCVTDATYSAGGFIGLTTLGSTSFNVTDDFGGGNLTTRRAGSPLFLD